MKHYKVWISFTKSLFYYPSIVIQVVCVHRPAIAPFFNSHLHSMFAFVMSTGKNLSVAWDYHQENLLWRLRHRNRRLKLDDGELISSVWKYSSGKSGNATAVTSLNWVSIQRDTRQKLHRRTSAHLILARKNSSYISSCIPINSTIKVCFF